MTVTHLARPRSVFGVLMDVIHAHPSMTMGRPGHGRATKRDQEALDQLPLHLRADLGLPLHPPPEPEPPSVRRARLRAGRWGG